MSSGSDTNRLIHTEGVPSARTYGDRRPYAVPNDLAELTRPANGRIVLPAELGWTGRTAYDLDDTSDAVVLYERVSSTRSAHRT